MISVIIPVYNRRELIARSIYSALAQTYHDIEIVVVDDASTDGTPEVVETVNDPRVRLITNSRNSGACVSRNRGIEAARGEYVAFLDSDDEWLPTKVEKQLAALETSGCSICSCGMRRYDTRGRLIETIAADRPGIIDRQKLLARSLVSTQTIMARRSVFDEVAFDEDVARLQDFEWVIRASKLFDFYMLAEPLVIAWLQEDSITNSGEEKLLGAANYIREKHALECSSNPGLQSYLATLAGQSKAFLGMPAYDEFALAWRLSHDPKALLQLLASPTPLYKACLHPLYRIYMQAGFRGK